MIYNNGIEKKLHQTLHSNFDNIISFIKEGNIKFVEKIIQDIMGVHINVVITNDETEPRGYWYDNRITINLFYSDKFNIKLIDEMVVTCMHEYIHHIQNNKRKTRNGERKLNIPCEHRKKFSSHEIMAYANTFALRAKYASLNKEQVFSAMNSGEIHFDNIFLLFKQYRDVLPRRFYNKFVRYTCCYIEDLYA